MFRKKSKLGQKMQFEKSAFLGFTPKLLPILDFGMEHWNNAKIQPIPKSRNFSKCFIAVFVTFLEIFGHLSEIFLDHWHNFFILITSASNLVECCRTQMCECTATFSLFVFGTRDIFYM